MVERALEPAGKPELPAAPPRPRRPLGRCRAPQRYAVPAQVLEERRRRLELELAFGPELRADLPAALEKERIRRVDELVPSLLGERRSGHDEEIDVRPDRHSGPPRV